MFFVQIGALLAMARFGLASIETPELTSCSDVQGFKLSDLKLTNAEVGQTMTLDFTLDITQKLSSSPQLKVTATTGDGQEIGCLLDLIGTCTYAMCGGTSTAEKALGSLWNNECPIEPNSYTKSYSFELPKLAKPFLGDGTFNVMFEVQDGGETVGCQKFPITIKV
uniref:Putative salivary lipocalin n=1 Tax=Ixodes ricinus TaxID=34613 RepID=A0A0K8R4X6_IXORI